MSTLAIEDREIPFRKVPLDDPNILYGLEENIYLDVSPAELYGLLRSRGILFMYIHTETEPIYICLDVISQGYEYQEWYMIYSYNFTEFMEYFLGRNFWCPEVSQKLDWRRVGF